MSLSRVVTRKGYNVPSHQHSTDYSPAKTEFVIIPLTNTPSFGSSFTIDVKELNAIYHELILQFNASAITVMTSGMFVPAQFWVDHIDYVVNGNIICTYYPIDQFMSAQLFQRDEDRLLENVSAGMYSSTSQRTTLATSASSYYLRLKDFYNQAKMIPMLEPFHNLQLKVYMNPLANITSGTGTATASFTSCNLIARLTRLREEEGNELRRQLAVNKFLHYKFNDVKPMSVTVGSGVTATNIVLSAITGPVAYLAFVVRPTASLTGNSAFAFTAISQYEMLNNSGSNIVGGQPISNSEALLVVGNSNAKSSYLSETALGSTNNNANVYIYSFASDAVSSALDGISSGHYKFTGNEQLKITFTSSLGASVQVDIFAYVESVLEVTKGAVQKRIFVH
jgi:hypothetical protein